MKDKELIQQLLLEQRELSRRGVMVANLPEALALISRVKRRIFHIPVSSMNSKYDMKWLNSSTGITYMHRHFSTTIHQSSSKSKTESVRVLYTRWSCLLVFSFWCKATSDWLERVFQGQSSCSRSQTALNLHQMEQLFSTRWRWGTELLGPNGVPYLSSWYPGSLAYDKFRILSFYWFVFCVKFLGTSV